jgi:hypothetical protein
LHGPASHVILCIFTRREERQSGRAGRKDGDPIGPKQPVPSRTLPCGEADVHTYPGTFHRCIFVRWHREEAMIERKSLPLQNHRHQRGSACLPAVSQVKQAGYCVPFPSYNIDSEGGLAAFVRIMASDFARGRLGPSRSGQSHKGTAQSALGFCLRGIRLQLFRPLWQAREIRGSTGGSLHKAVFPVGSRVSHNPTWVESLLSLSGT